MIEAPKHQQLYNCAVWNEDESQRAYLASKGEKNPAERSYLQRRAVRLKAQADSLFEQAHYEEREAFYAGVACDPSNNIYEEAAI